MLHFPDFPRLLKSSVSKQLFVPITKRNIGECAFSVAAPIIGNQLPIAIKSPGTIATFRKTWKTHLFEIAFSTDGSVLI